MEKMNSIGESLQVFHSPTPLTYDGHQLKPHFLLREFDLKGSSLGSFIGPCRVETSELVDLEDQLNQDRIEAKQMLHMIGEFFGRRLAEVIWIQRLLMAIIQDELNQNLLKQAGSLSAESPLQVTRDGDDLYCLGGKLSVSIVTSSPVSQLLHLGINIDPEGAPVEAIGLKRLGIDPERLIKAVHQRFKNEWHSVSWACVKVRPVI